MATTYTANAGSAAPTNPVRAVASRYRRASVSRNGLILDGVYHAESIAHKKQPYQRSKDRVVAIERNAPNRHGWSTPEAYGGTNEL